MTDKKIHKICKKYDITNYTINNGVVDVNGDVNFLNKDIRKLPLNFGIVYGCFECSINKLTSLKGSPKEVGGYFDCSYNELTTLDDAPQKIGGDFCCNDNILNSLIGSPVEVNGLYNCFNNELSSLNNAPCEVGSFFNCGNNIKKLSYENYIKGIERINKLKEVYD